jgi:hypothetical protein
MSIWFDLFAPYHVVSRTWYFGRNSRSCSTIVLSRALSWLPFRKSTDKPSEHSWKLQTCPFLSKSSSNDVNRPFEKSHIWFKQWFSDFQSDLWSQIQTIPNKAFMFLMIYRRQDLNWWSPPVRRPFQFDYPLLLQTAQAFRPSRTFPETFARFNDVDLFSMFHSPTSSGSQSGMQNFLTAW